MGYDNSIETAGYLTEGDRVVLKVLDLDGSLHTLEGHIPLWSSNEIINTGILNDVEIPENISISSVYPNPFNPSTNIEFSLDRAGDVNIGIYDINGRLVQELVQDNFSKGIYSIDWNASMYPSGVYFVKITLGNMSANQKLVLMK